MICGTTSSNNHLICTIKGSTLPQNFANGYPSPTGEHDVNFGNEGNNVPSLATITTKFTSTIDCPSSSAAITQIGNPTFLNDNCPCRTQVDRVTMIGESGRVDRNSDNGNYISDVLVPSLPSFWCDCMLCDGASSSIGVALMNCGESIFVSNKNAQTNNKCTEIDCSGSCVSTASQVSLDSSSHVPTQSPETLTQQPSTSQPSSIMGDDTISTPTSMSPTSQIVPSSSSQTLAPSLGTQMPTTQTEEPSLVPSTLSPTGHPQSPSTLLPTSIVVNSNPVQVPVAPIFPNPPTLPMTSTPSSGGVDADTGDQPSSNTNAIPSTMVSAGPTFSALSTTFNIDDGGNCCRIQNMGLIVCTTLLLMAIAAG